MSPSKVPTRCELGGGGTLQPLWLLSLGPDRRAGAGSECVVSVCPLAGGRLLGTNSTCFPGPLFGPMAHMIAPAADLELGGHTQPKCVEWVDGQLARGRQFQEAAQPRACTGQAGGGEFFSSLLSVLQYGVTWSQPVLGALLLSWLCDGESRRPRSQ